MRSLRHCFGKFQHATIGKAKAHLRHLVSRGEENLGAYFCAYCQKYHVGHKKSEKK